MSTLRLRKEQAGFLPNHSRIDQINTLRIIIEQCIERSSRLCTEFIDFEKAFDSINREAMWKEVKRYGVPTQIVNLITETYRGYAGRIAHEGRVSEPISVQTGVRQGRILLPTTFLTFKRRIKSHLPFAGIIRSSPYSPRFQDNG